MRNSNNVAGETLIFLHVPKTAGISVSQSVIRNFSDAEVYHVRNPEHVNGPVFSGFLGSLDGLGQATASINASAVNPAKIGKVMHYAFLLDEPFDFVSNPVSVTFVP